MSVHLISLFIDWIVWLLACLFLSLLYILYFSILILYQMDTLQRFSPFCKLPLHSVCFFFWVGRAGQKGFHLSSVSRFSEHLDFCSVLPIVLTCILKCFSYFFLSQFQSFRSHMMKVLISLEFIFFLGETENSMELIFAQDEIEGSMELFLYRLRERDLVSFFPMWTFSFPCTICWRGCLFSIVYFCKKVRWLLFHLDLLFSSTNLGACFGVSIMFSLLWLCSITWNQGWWSLQHWSFCLGLLWLCRIYVFPYEFRDLLFLSFNKEFKFWWKFLL